MSVCYGIKMSVSKCLHVKKADLSYPLYSRDLFLEEAQGYSILESKGPEKFCCSEFRESLPPCAFLLTHSSSSFWMRGFLFSMLRKDK